MPDSAPKISGRVIILQPTVPTYRLAFFRLLRENIGPSLVVYASAQDMGTLTVSSLNEPWYVPLGRIREPLPGLQWQLGAAKIPMSRNDIVVVSGNPRCISTFIVLIRARLIGAKSVWWGHHWSSTSRRWPASIRQRLSRLADVLLFYTDRETEEFKAAQGINDKRLVFALNNGIDKSGIEALRIPYDAASRPRDLLMIGRLTSKSQFEVLLNALSLEPGEQTKLDVIGNDEFNTAHLRSVAESKGLSSHITWHGGMTEESKIAAIANQCKVFVYPGAVGLSLIHALNYGLPAVVHANRWHHMPEIAAFNANSNGLEFDEGSATSLKRAIEAALSDPARLDAWSQCAIETVAATFNIEDMSNRFCAMIASIREGKCSPSPRHHAA